MMAGNLNWIAWIRRVVALHCLAVMVALLLPQYAAASTKPRVEAPVTRQSDAVAIAARVVDAKRQLATIWPPFWPESQAFIIHLEGQGALLISFGSRPVGYEAVTSANLPAALRGRAYWHSGTIADVKRPFMTNYPLGEGATAVLVNAGGSSAEEVTTLLLHEQFHAYQEGAFRRASGGQFISPAEIKDRVTFAAGAELERRVLAAAVSATRNRDVRELMKQYFSLRREREGTMSADSVRVERQFEQLEGTAKFVDRAGYGAIGEGADLRRLLVQELRKPLWLEGGPFTAVWFRTRSYGTGAALVYLSSQLGPADWRAKIEGGILPDQLVGSLVGEVPPPRSAALARTARARFGHVKILRELGPTVANTSATEIKSAEEFLARSPYRLVLEAKGGGKGNVGFDATGMAQLSRGTLALPMAALFNYSSPAVSLSARNLPVLIEGERSRYVVLTQAPPQVTGLEQAQTGEYQLASLTIQSGGIHLSVQQPVKVTISEKEIVVRLMNNHPEPPPVTSAGA